MQSLDLDRVKPGGQHERDVKLLQSLGQGAHMPIGYEDIQDSDAGPLVPEDADRFPDRTDRADHIPTMTLQKDLKL